jgi:integrase
VSGPPKRFFCAGTNRFGRPCNNRVEGDGDTCGYCSGPATFPTPTVTTSASVSASASAASEHDHDDWTLAPKLRDRLAPLADANPALGRLVEVCVRLARNSRADGSKAVYDQHWRTFRVFCDTVGLPAELPVSAETAACFLAWLADAGRVDRATGERTGSGEPLRHGYLRQAVAAIGYRHELEGLASPLHDPLVQAVLRGYGRIHGTDVRGKDPIRLDDLTRIATALPRPLPTAARDRALALLATHPDHHLGAGQLARLNGEHILLPNDPTEPVVLLVHPGGRSLGLDVIEIPPDDEVPQACAARAITELAPDPFGPVFRSPAKQRLSRQGVLKILRVTIAAAGLAAKASRDGVPRLPDAMDRARLAGHITGPDPAQIRDLALILNLYWGSFRGSELCAMRWADARLVAQGVEWTIGRAKNDQLGHGETIGAARNPNPLLCPATALDAWHATLTATHGRPPRPGEPVFVRLDHHADPPKAITRDGASQIVKRAARTAGLTGDYASHSLRAGFVTDALDAGATREQVQRHGRWANITSLDSYYRKTHTWGPNNPSQHLATHHRHDD